VKKPLQSPVTVKPFPWWIVAVMVLVVLAGAGAALYFVLPRTFVVPSVVGSREADAEKVLADAGLTVTKTIEATAGIAPGTVKDQSPKPPKRVKRGEPVALVVAAALPTWPTMIRVPPVKGHRLQIALLALLRAGLDKISISQFRRRGIPISRSVGTVLSVSPDGGTPVEPGTHINLTLGVTAIAPWETVLSPAERALISNNPGITLR
jgi:beta-lactam-binding protein with PASTA domain